MKRRFFCILLLAYSVERAAFSGMPQPMVVYYGQAKDCFGWPYMKNASVILMNGTREIARHDISGSMSPGVNFALYVPVDDGRDTNRYVRNALRTGEVVTIVVRDYYGQKTIMESNTVPPVTAPGDMILVNATAGTDADGDGLPDEWENLLIEWSCGALTSIWDVAGTDDFDADRQSNMDEYRAGTFPFLDYDYFYAERFAQTSNGRLRISFLSVAGKVYRVWGAPLTLSGGQFDWRPHPYALTENGPLTEGPAEGTGYWFDFFVPLSETNQVFRLTVR